MKNQIITTILVVSLVGFSIQNTEDNEINIDIAEESPFAEAAASILKEQNMENIGSIVNNVLQSGAAKDMMGDLLQNVASSPQAAQILGGIGSMLAASSSSNNDKENSEPSVDLLQGLGSVLGSLQGAGDGGGALLQGLGSLLNAGSENKKAGGGIDPAIIGSLVNMYMNAQNLNEPKPKQKRATKKTKAKPSQPEDDSGFDLGSIMSVAGSLLSNVDGDKVRGVLADYAPMVIQAVTAFTGPEAEERAKSHSGHSKFLPPVLEKLHVMFDNFLHSDMAKTIWSSLGGDKAFQMFADDEGSFNYTKFVDMMENHSFRRHWLRVITDKLASYLQILSDPATYQDFISYGQFFVNNFVKSQGFPKNTMIDPKKPVESISKLIDYGAKKYFDAKIKSKEYVKPVIVYLQDLLRMAEKKSLTGKDSKQLSDVLADTINLEIIEPMARVHRAYRFSKRTPECDRYIFCLINEDNSVKKESFPSIKRMLSKASSLFAYWYMGDVTKTPFLDIYKDIFDATDCKTLHLEKCNEFHEEEIRVTTEYVHNEL